MLVTGGAGFIGSHVVDRLIEAGQTPRILDARPSPYRDDVDTVIGDIRRLEDVIAAARGCDAIIHLAAAADVGEVAEDPVGAEQVNSRGTLNVLDAARELGIGRVLYASTIWVYSDVTERHVDEDTLLPAPAHLYTATKLAGELYCRSYHELYGVQCTILRFGIPYGPRARPAAVVPTFVNKALAGEPLTLAGGGKQARRFVYVEDLAEGVVSALAPVAANRTYNLVGEEDVTIRQIAEQVRSVLGDVEVVETPGRSGDFRGAEVSGVRAAEELGWRPGTPFCEGLEKYVAWHRAHPVTAAPKAEVQPVPEPASALTRIRSLLRLPERRGLGRAIALLLVGLVAGLLAAALSRTSDLGDPVNVLATLMLVSFPAALVARVNWARSRADGALVVAAMLTGAVIALDVDWARDLSHLARSHPGLTLFVLLLAAVTFNGVRRRLRAAGANASG